MSGDGVELATAYIALVPSLQDKSLISQVTSAGSKAGSEGGKAAGKSFGGKFLAVQEESLRKLSGVVAGAFAVERVAEFGKKLVEEAASYSKSITLLQTAGGESQKNLAGISKGIINISDQVGFSADDLAEGMYTMEKAGLRGAAGLTTLKNAAEGAKAENVDMATMANAVTSIMTSYHLKASQSATAVNELVAASGAAKTTMQQFAGSLSTVLPLASASGISFAQVGGAIATLTQHGTSADEATQELNNTIRALAAPNLVAQKEMQQLGISTVDLSKNLGKRGLTGSLDLVVNKIAKSMGPSGLVMLNAFRKSQSAGQDLQTMLKSMPPDLQKLSQAFLDGTEGYSDYQKAVKGYGANESSMGLEFLSLAKQANGFNTILQSGAPNAQTFTDALKRIMGGATGMNTALQLSGENMAGFESRVNEVAEAQKKSTGTVSTWATTQATAAVQMDRFSNSIHNLGLEAALAALPTVSKVVGGLANDLQHDGPAISSWAKTTFAPWGSALDAVGSLISSTFSAFEHGGLTGGLGLFSAAIKTTGTAVEGIAKSLDLVPGPLKTLTVDLIAGGLAFKALSSGVAAFKTTALVTSFGKLRSEMGLIAADRQWSTAMATWESEGLIVSSRLNTTSRAAKDLSAGFSKAGAAAKQAAGVGGILLLTSSLTKAASNVGTLETAVGGAAAGSMFGPWGAAIGGAAGLLLGLHRQADAAAKAAEALRVETTAQIKVKVDQSAVDSLIRALERANGDYAKLDNNTKLGALNTAASNPKSGFSTSAVTSMTGLTKQTQADIFAGDPTATKVGRQALAALTEQLDSFTEAQDKAASVSDWSSWASYMSSTGSVAAKDFSKWGDALSSAYSSGAITGQQYKTMLGHLTAAEADGTETAQERNQAIADGNTLYAAAGNKAKSYTAADKALKTELASGGATLTGYHQKLAQTANYLGLMVSQFKKLPKNTQLKLEADGAPQTYTQLQKVLGDLGKFATFKEIKTVLSLSGVNLSQQQIEGLQKKYHLTQHEITTLVNLKGVSGAIGQVNSLAGAIDSLHDKTVTVTEQQKIATVRTSPTHSAGGGTVPLGGAYFDKYPYLLAPGERIVPDNNGQVRNSKRILDMVANGMISDKSLGFASKGATVGMKATRISMPQISTSRASARSAQSVVVAAPSMDGATVYLRTEVGDFAATVEMLADGRVAANSSMAGMLGRAGA